MHHASMTTVITVICGAVLLAGFLGSFLPERMRQPPPPRQPADISPFTAALLTGQRQNTYKPHGVTAVTPDGIRVTVTCPHTGHRTPAHALACGQREKNRIETLGW